MREEVLWCPVLYDACGNQTNEPTDNLEDAFYSF